MDVFRFYAPELSRQAAEGAWIQLPEDQAHHARTVLRLEAGVAVVVFDGRGAWAPGVIARGGREGISVCTSAAVTVDPRPQPMLTLATAVPKGERAEWLIEQASQLNVAQVQFVACARSVVKPHEGGHKMEKWRRLAVESAKQCGRTHVLRILAPAPFAVVAAPGPRPETARLLWLDPGSGGMTVAEALAGMKEDGVTAFIGPEGGWSEDERHCLEGLAGRGGIRRVRLTATVLRIETACAALAAVVMSRGVL